jgi:ABC-type transport system involved in cytochrome c biogenesis permease subunit
MSLRLASNRLGQTVLPSLLGTVAAATGAAGVFVATGIVLFGGAWSGAAVGEVESEDDAADAS